MTATIALGFPAEATLTVTEIVECAAAAELAGLDCAWAAEGRAGESFATLSAIALQTERIGVGAGILPIFSRSPWLVAMGAACIDELSAGRFLLGLGVGHKAVVEDRHGLKFEHPLRRLRETIEIVRAVHGGGAVDYDGEVFRLRGSELSVPPRRADMPIVVAAMGPRTLRLAGELADGAFLFFATPGSVGQAAAEVAAGRAISGRGPEAVRLLAYVPTCVSTDRLQAIEASRGVVAYYGRLAHYQAIFARQGFADEAECLRAAWAERDPRAAIQAVSDEMVVSLTASGSPDDVAEAIGAFADSGLDQVVLYPYPASGGALGAFRAAIDAVGPVARDLAGTVAAGGGERLTRA